jgi:hypothetical protein
MVLGLTLGAGTVRAGPLYPLYYAIDMPPVLTGYELDERKDKHLIYTSLLRGALGGLPIEAGAVTLRPGASAGAGGGEFSLKTAAGTVKGGLILMTSDGRQMTLLFTGTYLGERLQFRMAGPAKDFGTATVASKGLADTTFIAHSEYLAAVTHAVANLTPALQAQTITAADNNLRLITAYQSSPGAP